MDGILNLDKPTGITSAKALYRVRSLTGIRKSGHAGTLDPGASGVLLLCMQKATKLVERLMDLPKVYRATARLDVTSASFDADAELVPVPVDTIPAAEQVRAALDRFEGVIQQVPPAVSAVKIDGRPAYKLARKGITPELKARPARIDWLVIHRYAWPDLDFEMSCGRGTYVRSVIRDLGLALGCGGCLTSLVRTAVGPFRQSAGFGLETLAALPDARVAIQPLDQVLHLLDQPIAIPQRPSAGE